MFALSQIAAVHRRTKRARIAHKPIEMNIATPSTGAYNAQCACVNDDALHITYTKQITG